MIEPIKDFSVRSTLFIEELNRRPSDDTTMATTTTTRRTTAKPRLKLCELTSKI